jgi:hypothetical protein
MTRALPAASSLPRRLAWFAALALLLTACAPSAFPTIGTDPAAAELRRTADILYHRMELGYLETGVYTTNALIDVSLPEGAKWTLLDFAQDGSSYALLLTSTRYPDAAWRITPRGVARASAP